jgi:5-methylcytosine-specific restriction endonuclease McrA
MADEIISRAEARARGLKRYFTGKPCKHGHISHRLLSSPRCAECLYLKGKRVHKKWRDKNKDKISGYRIKGLAKPGVKERKKLTDKQWRENNLEKSRAYTRKYVKENPEKAFLSTKKWRENNPEMVRAHWSNRRAREVSAPGSYTAKDIAGLFKMQLGKCAYYKFCRTSLGNNYHVDHIIALVNGGSNFRSNLQLLCPHCNLSKLAKDPVVFSQSLGFLL